MPEHDPQLPSSLRARIEDDCWARALGAEYLELRRGYCRVALSLTRVVYGK